MSMAIALDSMHRVMATTTESLAKAKLGKKEAEQKAEQAEKRANILQSGLGEEAFTNTDDETGTIRRAVRRKMSSMNLLQPGHRRRVARGAKLTHRY